MSTQYKPSLPTSPWLLLLGSQTHCFFLMLGFHRPDSLIVDFLPIPTSARPPPHQLTNSHFTLPCMIPSEQKLTLLAVCLIMSCSSSEDCLMVHWSKFCNAHTHTHTHTPCNSLSQFRLHQPTPSGPTITSDTLLRGVTFT